MCGGIFLSVSLQSCHDISPLDESTLPQKELASAQALADQSGVSLKTVVSRPGVIYADQKKSDALLSDEAKLLVGRYHVRLSCEDPIALCKEGEADFIVNLLPDGYVRRTIVYLGSVSPIDEGQYRQDQWTFDAKRQEVVVHLVEGAKFYLELNDAKNLVMNINRTRNASIENQKFYAEFYLPRQPYELQKIE